MNRCRRLAGIPPDAYNFISFYAYLNFILGSKAPLVFAYLKWPVLHHKAGLVLFFAFYVLFILDIFFPVSSYGVWVISSWGLARGRLTSFLVYDHS